MRIAVQAVSGIMLATAVAKGQTMEVKAASCSVPDIQKAVDQLGEEGGVVRVPEGKAEAVGTVEIPGKVTLRGAGAKKTVLFRGGKTKPHSNQPIIRINKGEDSRVTRLSLVGFREPKNAAWDSGLFVRDARDFRIDRCQIERFGMGGVYVTGESRGVIDHCLFVDNFKKTINNVGYGVVVYGPGTWRKKVVPGSKNAVFIEDCEIRGARHAVASNSGAFYVFRHNHVIGNDNSQAIDAHGPGYGSKRGTQWIEVYGNLIEKPVGGSMAMCLRGGGGVIFDNEIRDYKGAISVTLDFDAKLDWTRPYPIPDQIRKLYLWDNTLDGKPAKPTISTRSAKHIKRKRDYFLTELRGYRPYTYPHPLTRKKRKRD